MTRKIVRGCGLVGALFAACWAGACNSVKVVPIDEPEGADASLVDATSGADVADALVGDGAVADADADAADAAPVVLERVSGHVDYGGPIAGAAVTLLAPSAMSTTTDSTGDFFFYVPVGSTAVIKVVAPNLFPMIRGVVTTGSNRVRNFYLAGPPEEQAAQALGVQFDPTKGIVEVDFRNATVGGYGVALKNGAAAVSPSFGIALDDMGAPQSSMITLAGGDGSTLLLGNVAPGSLSFAPQLPDAGVTACKPCDAPVLPVQAGVVTWFDFECGSATDCQ